MKAPIAFLLACCLLLGGCGARPAPPADAASGTGASPTAPSEDAPARDGASKEPPESAPAKSQAGPSQENSRPEFVPSEPVPAEDAPEVLGEDPVSAFLDTLSPEDYSGIYFSQEDQKIHLIPFHREELQEAVDARPELEIVIDGAAPACSYQQLLDAQELLFETEELGIDMSYPDIHKNCLVIGAREWTEERKALARELAGPVPLEFRLSGGPVPIA